VGPSTELSHPYVTKELRAHNHNYMLLPSFAKMIFVRVNNDVVLGNYSDPIFFRLISSNRGRSDRSQT
jgi:hypothetical protein